MGSECGVLIRQPPWCAQLPSCRLTARPLACLPPTPPSQAALEDAWRRREAEREAEAASLRSEYAGLEGKAQQVLAAAEQREARLVAAEEAAARRRRELEREHASRVAEAEAAVRRLQSECQHQLELEAQRREALAKEVAAAEARAAAAEARAAAADRALQRHREQHSASAAGRTEAELAAARAELATAEARAAKAAEAKRKYKEQVGAAPGWALHVHQAGECAGRAKEAGARRWSRLNVRPGCGAL